MLKSATPAFQSRNNMNLKDLKIESYPPRNVGGQNVGWISTGVKVTHVPSELVAICAIERSQKKNRDVAIAMIEAGLEKMNWNHYAV